MDTILVDTENIRNDEFKDLEKLTNYKIVFFETPNTINNRIALTTVMKMLKAKIEVDYLKVNVAGKNALDFQICTYAGILKSEEDDIYVLSHDKGFDNLKTFNIMRIEAISNLITLNELEEEIKLIIKSKFPYPKVFNDKKLIKDIKKNIACLNKVALNNVILPNIRRNKENVTQDEATKLYNDLVQLMKFMK